MDPKSRSLQLDTYSVQSSPAQILICVHISTLVLYEILISILLRFNRSRQKSFGGTANISASKWWMYPRDQLLLASGDCWYCSFPQPSLLSYTDIRCLLTGHSSSHSISLARFVSAVVVANCEIHPHSTHWLRMYLCQCPWYFYSDFSKTPHENTAVVLKGEGTRIAKDTREHSSSCYIFFLPPILPLYSFFITNSNTPQGQICSVIQVLLLLTSGLWNPGYRDQVLCLAHLTSCKALCTPNRLLWIINKDNK